MQSTTVTPAAGKRKDHKGRDGATSSSVHHGTSVSASAAVNDSAKPTAYGGPSGPSDDDSPDVIAMENELMNRFVARGPSSEPVKGAPLKSAGSWRDRHHQLPAAKATAAVGSSARGSNIPPKVHTPAKTATQPTTAGSGKRRPS